jgi:hypothetical protein
VDVLEQIIALTPPWLLIAFGSIGTVLIAYAVLILIPDDPNLIKPTEYGDDQWRSR